MKERKQFDSIKYALNRVGALIEVSVFSLMYFYVWSRFYTISYVASYYSKGRILIVLIYALLLITVFSLTDGLKFGYLKLTNIVISQWVSLVLCNVITYLQLGLIAGRLVPVFWMVLLLLAELLFSFVCVYFFTEVYHHFYIPRKMLLVYKNDLKAMNLKSKMETRSDKYRISSIISIDEGLDYIKKELVNYDALVIDSIPDLARNDLLMYCYSNNISTYIVPEITDIFTRGAMSIDLFDTPLLHPKRDLTFFQIAVKRVFDIFVSSVALILLSPVFLFVSLLIKIEDNGPVFYKQMRLTKGGRTFKVIKFRSMRIDAEKDGVARLAAKNDDRITRVGKFIRACRLDEIPQFINVFKGDMSFVGPRPERPEIAEQFINNGIPYDLRLRVKAGLTGYAQIIGKYNTTAEDKLRLDLIYIENYSFLMDLKLIFMTLRVIFQKESTEGV